MARDKLPGSQYNAYAVCRQMTKRNSMGYTFQGCDSHQSNTGAYIQFDRLDGRTLCGIYGFYKSNNPSTVWAHFQT